MSTALQCPDCGQKHPLGSVGDQPVFPCARCSRPLKVPAAYRPGTNGSGNGTGRAAARRPAGSSKPAQRRRGGSMSMPVKILLWVVAFALGAVVVRSLAKWTGFVGGDTLVDLLIDHSFGNYFRLFVLVPFWALFSTLFLTLFLEGPDWFRRRRARTATGPRTGRTATTARVAGTGVAATVGAASRGATRTAGAATRAGATGTIPKRVPATAAAAAAGAAVGAATRPRTIPRRGEASVEPVAAAAAPRPDDRTQALAVAPSEPEPAPEPVDEYAARAAAGHRPRRIPRRTDGS